ncbi:hypothetical protein [Scytonema millei]|uniref:Uncharacterized protein n=1 Tax=Scytonema millei VB511283 TaxID=1245923 RepID=A0A9X5I4B5_9CYAN|nr:hypothetical protein [Scytonema millei]NHC35413.1 hypothetical protein [Scytonema millei VB511283]
MIHLDFSRSEDKEDLGDKEDKEAILVLLATSHQPLATPSLAPHPFFRIFNKFSHQIVLL